MFSCKFVIILS